MPTQLTAFLYWDFHKETNMRLFISFVVAVTVASCVLINIPMFPLDSHTFLAVPIGMVVIAFVYWIIGKL